MYTTLRYRIKDSTTKKKLQQLASTVNFVWNYCNATSFDAIRNFSKFLSVFDLNNLMAGSSKELPLHSQTFQAIAKEYVTRRKQFKKRKLKWRSYKKSLGWIPVSASAIKLQGSEIVYQKVRYKIWLHRPIIGVIKSGSFNQDSRGNWYVNLQCEIPDGPSKTEGEDLGIDLGLKEKLTLSNGKSYTRENLTKSFEVKLAKAQRARRFRIARKIQAKIRNKRKDWNHKRTYEIVQAAKRIVLGDLNLPKTKSVYDAGFSQIKNYLHYKAIRYGVNFNLINESYSTCTCSNCSARSGPSGLRGLGVREWTCSVCGSFHNRDVNAAKNILRFGTESPINGSPAL